jgi:hypothetical protein
MLRRPAALSGRELLICAIVAVTGCLALSLLLYLTGTNLVRQSEFRFSRIRRGDLHVDVLIVGNSRARDLIVGRPPDARPSVYNLAYNGLSRTETLAWIRLFFEQGNTASTVVVESSALFSDEVLCDGKVYWPLYPELRALEARACPRDAGAERFFPLTLLDSEQFMRAIYYLRRSDQDWGDGYTIPRSRCEQADINEIFTFRKHAEAMDQVRAREQLDELHTWMDMHSPQTRLVFVLAPFLASPGAVDSIADIERIDRKFLTHEHHISLATLLGSDCERFADAVHVGPQGRPIVANALFAALSTLREDDLSGP